MPHLSIITPVHPATAPFIEAAGKSVASINLPDGWTYEWVVQEDGTHLVAEVVGDVGGIYACNSKPAGVSITRNLALLRAKGDLVFSLDADDMLLPDGLGALVDGLQPKWGWATGGHLNAALEPHDWRRDKSRTYDAGELASLGNTTWDFHANNLLARRHVLWQVGGWPAIMGMEDRLLLTMVNFLHPGAALDIPTVQYRHHPDQTVASSTFAQDFYIYINQLETIRQANGYIDSSSKHQGVIREPTHERFPGNTTGITSG